MEDLKMSKDTVSINPALIGMNDSEYKALRGFLTSGQFKSALRSCQSWMQAGEAMNRLKAAKREHKIGGKFPELVNEFFGCEISNDERSCAMKLVDNKADVLSWFTKSNCNKHHPRSIWAEFNGKGKTKAKTPEEMIKQALATAEKVMEKYYPELAPEAKAEITKAITAHGESLVQATTEAAKAEAAKLASAA
jgi:hypothetical protein